MRGWQLWSNKIDTTWNEIAAGQYGALMWTGEELTQVLIIVACPFLVRVLQQSRPLLWVMRCLWVPLCLWLTWLTVSLAVRLQARTGATHAEAGLYLWLWLLALWLVMVGLFRIPAREKVELG
ncbi:MAG: hypothetical protein QM755_03110 [Luteolibacter sp.]